MGEKKIGLNIGKSKLSFIIFIIILFFGLVSAKVGYNIDKGVSVDSSTTTNYINGSNLNLTTTTCSGSDKVSAINNATGVVTCTADSTGAGGGNTTEEMQDAVGNSVGNGLTYSDSANWLNATDTSGIANQTNTPNSFLQNITFDTFGHVLSIIASAVDFSAYTTTANLINALGNWSADKTNYYNKSEVYNTTQTYNRTQLDNGSYFNSAGDSFAGNFTNFSAMYAIGTNNTFTQLSQLNNGTYAIYQFVGNNFNGTGYFNTSGQVNGSTLYSGLRNLTIPYYLATNNTFAQLTQLNNGTYIINSVLNNGSYFNSAGDSFVGNYSRFLIIDALATNNTFAQLTQLNNGTYALYSFIGNNFDGTGYFNTSGQVNGSTVYSGLRNLTIPYYLTTNNTFAQLTQLNNGTYIINSVLNNGTYIINSILNNGSYFNVASSGDITSVNTTLDAYIYNGSDSGDVFLRFNETKLNLTTYALLTQLNNGTYVLMTNTSYYLTTNPSNFFSNLSNFTGNLTDTRFCTYNITDLRIWCNSTSLDSFAGNFTNFSAMYAIGTNNTFAQLTQLNNGTYVINSVLNNGTYIINSVLNNGSYFNSGGTGTIVGAGTDGRIARFNGTTSINDSVIYQNGTKVSIGITNPQATFHVNGTGQFNGTIFPEVNNSHDLGNSTNRFKTLYAITLDFFTLITTSQIADSAITAIKLATESVTAIKIALGAVNTTHILDNTILSNDLGADVNVSLDTRYAIYQFVGNNFNGTGYFNTSGQVNGSTVYSANRNLSIGYLMSTNNTFAQLTQLNNGTYIVQSMLNNGTYAIYQFVGNNFNGTGYFNTSGQVNGSTVYSANRNLSIGYLMSTNNTFAELTGANFTGNVNVTVGNLSSTGRIKLAIASDNCVAMVSGEICRNATGIFALG